MAINGHLRTFVIPFGSTESNTDDRTQTLLSDPTVQNFMNTAANVLSGAIALSYVNFWTFPGNVPTFGNGLRCDLLLTDTGDTTFENNLATLRSQLGNFVTWTTPISFG